MELRYGQYLNDPSAVVNWSDVIEVRYKAPSLLVGLTDSSGTRTQCPICMEEGASMVAPRVAKCGHMFCYACLLQYLDYEREYAWKKCPLCADPIYKRDIRRVRLVVTNELKEQTYENQQGTRELTFKLTVRCKSNINVKMNQNEKEESKQNITILEGRLPSVNDLDYKKSRVMIGDEGYIREAFSTDLDSLR